jgi:hypothetical protein
MSEAVFISHTSSPTARQNGDERAEPSRPVGPIRAQVPFTPQRTDSIQPMGGLNSRSTFATGLESENLMQRKSKANFIRFPPMTKYLRELFLKSKVEMERCYESHSSFGPWISALFDAFLY